MSKKLYIQLLLIALVGSQAVADSDGFFKAVGRTFTGNGSAVSNQPAKRISFSDAKDLKRQMRDASKKVSSISDAKKEAVRTQVVKLSALINDNQVLAKGKRK